jgi:hypothetical protein
MNVRGGVPPATFVGGGACRRVNACVQPSFNQPPTFIQRNEPLLQGPGHCPGFGLDVKLSVNLLQNELRQLTNQEVASA